MNSNEITNNNETKNEHISLRVINQVIFLFQKYKHNILFFSKEGNEIYFKIRYSTPLKKLMMAYCERFSIDLNSIRFLFNGQRIQLEQTALDVNIQS